MKSDIKANAKNPETEYDFRIISTNTGLNLH
jgi:hypothetical protein